VTIRARIEAASGGFPPLVLRDQASVVQDPGTLILEVEDNGVGMDPAQTESSPRDPLQNPDRLARIGLDNVDRRMRLHFGETSGLSVESTLGEWTRVRLVLPVLRRAPGA
jgi:two-component system sensor histidine kinase YesM